MLLSLDFKHVWPFDTTITTHPLVWTWMGPKPLKSSPKR
jgi:hypothetical protein